MLIPLQDNVILEKFQEENKTRSGIILSAAPANSPVAKVLAVGPEVKESLLQAGVHVLYAQDKAMTASADGKEYLIVRSKDIAAIVE